MSRESNKIEIGVNKLKASVGALTFIAIGIAPFYFVDLNNLTPQDIAFPPIAIFMFYASYRYFIKRLLMGAIITLTKDLLIVKDEGKVNTYRWATVKRVKVEVVTEKNMNNKDVSYTMLTVWTTLSNKSDLFHISDLEMKSDEIRELINTYTVGTITN